MGSPIEYVGRNRIRAIVDDGHFVVLENGSRWEIPNPEERTTVSGWGRQDVWVTADRFGEGEFILATGDAGPAVHGKFAGEVS